MPRKKTNSVASRYLPGSPGERGMALNMKEFARANGISYSTARAWFRIDGFPAFEGYIFLEDFQMWRRKKLGLGIGEPAPGPAPAVGAKSAPEPQSPVRRTRLWTGRAAQILHEFD